MQEMNEMVNGMRFDFLALRVENENRSQITDACVLWQAACDMKVRAVPVNPVETRELRQAKVTAAKTAAKTAAYEGIGEACARIRQATRLTRILGHEGRETFMLPVLATRGLQEKAEEEGWRAFLAEGAWKAEGCSGGDCGELWLCPYCLGC